MTKKERKAAFAQLAKTRRDNEKQLEAAQVIEMLQLFDEGHSVCFLARKYNVRVDFVLDVTMGKKWGGVTRRLPFQTVVRNARVGRPTVYWPKKTALYPYDAQNMGGAL